MDSNTNKNFINDIISNGWSDPVKYLKRLDIKSFNNHDIIISICCINEFINKYYDMDPTILDKYPLLHPIYGWAEYLKEYLENDLVNRINKYNHYTVKFPKKKDIYYCGINIKQVLKNAGFKIVYYGEYDFDSQDQFDLMKLLGI